MKHQTLRLLQEHNFLVPNFITVDSPSAYTPTKSFLLDNDKLYAVRSSFQTEDGATNSFAGQFDTILNVNKKDIPAAIQRVFDSAKASNVFDYEKAVGIDNKATGCVIIQEMVDAEMSGVIFTANPLGILNETVITIGSGLGCNVVEDKVPTTSYFYNQDDDIYYHDTQPGAPEIDTVMMKKLLTISKEIKRILKYDVDIEFAIKANHIFILQARPITTLSTKAPIILDNSNIVESYPGVSLPLTQDFVVDVYHNIFFNLVKRISNAKLAQVMDPHLQHMTAVTNWRMYYQISNWYTVLKLLPFSNKIIPMWQKMLGVENIRVDAHNVNVSIADKWNIFWNFLRYLKNSPCDMGRLNSDFSQKYPSYQRRISETDDIDDLIAVYEDIKWDILSEWDLTLINDMYTFINTALAGDKNKHLLANVKNLESMGPARAMTDLIRIAQELGLSSEEYVFASQSYIEKFGDRCLCELKLETPTYRSNPALLNAHVHAQISQELPSNNEQTEHADIKHYNLFVRRAKTGIANRETSRLNRSRIFGLSRHIFLKIGDRLVQNHQIDDPKDVFYLHINELTNGGQMQELIASRKIEQEYFEKIPAYSRLVFDGKIIDKHGNISNCDVLTKINELHGITTSTGKVIAPVVIVDESDIGLDTTGKILVTKSTDPGWVFLINNAVGIIAEKGSLLSHTAIISRELHKPAIVNVKDCTRSLCNGDIVELDADNGRISIIKRYNEEAS